MDEWEVFPRVAVATARQAIAEGVARLTLNDDQLLGHARRLIRQAQNATSLLMEQGIIPRCPQ
jgi:hypothetical protein